MVFGFCGYSEISKFNPQMRYFLENVNFGFFEYMAILGGVTSKMGFMDMNSNCLNGGQKYNAYLSHAFSRKNLPYWLMCRKTRICAIYWKIWVIFKIEFPSRSGNMGQNGNPSQSGVRVGVPDKTMKLYLEHFDFKYFSRFLWTFT